MYIYKTQLTTDNFINSTDTLLKPQYLDELNRRCDSFRGKPIPALEFSKFRLYDETGNRSIYQQRYYCDLRMRLTSFAIRTWLFHEEEDVRELEDILWAICDEYTWALPAHLGGILTNDSISPQWIDLFAAETGQSIAEILSLCGEYVHEKVKKRCIDEVFRRIINVFEAEEIGWEKLLNNWAAVCGGCVGMTALYLIEDEERLKKITDRAANSCNMFIKSCSDDGACPEGISYWNYAMQYYTAFNELLNERMGQSIVRDEQKIKRIAEFPSFAIFENNNSIRFGDVWWQKSAFGVLCKLKERYGVPIPIAECYDRLIEDCARTCGAIRNIAWFNDKFLHNNARCDDVIFNRVQWAVLNRDNARLVIKGGVNCGDHNHADIGSFMYIKNGCVLCDDVGCAEYSSSTDKLIRQSLTHSVPIVNNTSQGWGEEFSADVFERIDDKIHISFAGAYKKEAGLTALNRYAQINENGLTICDCFEFENDKNIVSDRVITKYKPKILDDKIQLLQGGGKIAEINYDKALTINISNLDYEKPWGGMQKIYMIDFCGKTDNKQCEVKYSVSYSE